ncbi:MAG: squalene/phytoene synthase family protein, partial [Solirubrobacteraceae bacterium]
MQTASLYLASPEVPDAAGVMERSGGENFSVAARVLSRSDRRHLLALYGFARLADEIGDAHADGRLAALDWLEGELDRAFAGEACDPLLRALQGTLMECGLPRAPLAALIEANRIDQRVTLYETWEQLEGYCALSANPVGELVLRVFGLLTPARLALSDRVCTALQLVEHLQDLSEDVARGRMYVPAEDLARFGATHEQLGKLCARAGEEGEGKGVRVGVAAQNNDPGGARGAVRETVRFETERVRELLGAGAPLVASVPGRAKL